MTDRQVRAWAKRNGYRLSDKHPIPLFVEVQYRRFVSRSVKTER